MIQTEMVEDRIRHYSDAGLKIKQIETGIIYDDAVDVLPCRYPYEDTDIPREDIDDDPEIQDSRALRIITGEEEE